MLNRFLRGSVPVTKNCVPVAKQRADYRASEKNLIPCWCFVLLRKALCALLVF